mmetsp:Transcript_22608/g.39930  ORF Transcript_22608/g.39930 Transcript_22608/m.39930 type:complete len:312 (+) Transcript_22608:214-1149(+)
MKTNLLLGLTSLFCALGTVLLLALLRLVSELFTTSLCNGGLLGSLLAVVLLGLLLRRTLLLATLGLLLLLLLRSLSLLLLLASTRVFGSISRSFVGVSLGRGLVSVGLGRGFVSVGLSRGLVSVVVFCARFELLLLLSRALLLLLSLQLLSILGGILSRGASLGSLVGNSLALGVLLTSVSRLLLCRAGLLGLLLLLGWRLSLGGSLGGSLGCSRRSSLGLLSLSDLGSGSRCESLDALFLLELCPFLLNDSVQAHAHLVHDSRHLLVPYLLATTQVSPRAQRKFGLLERGGRRRQRLASDSCIDRARDVF